MKKTCYPCGIVVPEGEQQLAGEEVLCPECYENHNYCIHCGSLENTDDLTYIESVSGYVCTSCIDERYSLCSHCYELFESMERTIDGWRLCPSCMDDHTYTCEDCGSVYYNEDIMFWDEHACVYYCESCYQNNSLIKGYHDHKYEEKIFFGNPDNGRYWGTEIEIEVQGADRADLEEIAQALEQEELYFEEDGSLDDGFEIITQPMSLEYSLTSFNWINLGDVLVEHCVNPSRNCGMHVHVSRTGIDMTTINKIIVLVENNYNNLMPIIGRDYNQYSESFFKESKKYSLKDAEEVNKRSRYNWLNNTNKATIEFRFFSSTTDGKLIKDRLVFLNDLIEFCLANEVTEDTVVSLSENKLVVVAE